MAKKFLVFLLTFLSCNQAFAELYKINFEGESLKALSALELKLILEPKDLTMLDEEIKLYINKDKNVKEEIPRKDILFRFVDPQNSFIRVFFRDAYNFNNLSIEGKIIRVNFSGEMSMSIAAVNYIPDFGRNISPDKIKYNLTVTDDRDVLPFYGISKATILGPRSRTYREQLYITISDIETYGFSIGANAFKARINGVPARIINDEIVTAQVPVAKNLSGKSLDIVLEVDVDNKTISKRIGSLNIIESITSK
jgi:hypothetical protein